MKEKIEQLKEFAGKLGSKTKKLIIAGAVLLVAAAVIIALVLNNRPYEVLFSGLGKEEAQQIVSRLQEDGVGFKLQDESTILVRKDVVDVTKAKLVQEGYPKSGFTYDTFIDNAGLMTTDSDKRTYKLYELQNRIGSTIRLFENVKDAKVTIALGEESKYVLDDSSQQESSATAVVTMNDGGTPTEEQAAAIQRLVAKSIPGMELTQVAVFDGNGTDVSVADGETMPNGSDAEEIASVIEDQIENKVHDVLGPIYGNPNVRVSARAIVDMQNLIRETTTYNTPEKIDEKDKTGIISHEEGINENSSNGTGVAGGEVGTESNADTTEYASGNNAGSSSRSESESFSKDYLVDQIKEQGQVAPGALTDLTVSVAINGRNYGNLTEKQIRDLVGNAAGIAAGDRADKISLVSAPFYEQPEEEQKTAAPAEAISKNTLIILIAAAAALLLVLIILILIIRRRNKKKEEEELLAAEEEMMSSEALLNEEMEKERLNREIQAVQNDRGMQLKKNIRDFAEQNPEISAQLLKSWLNGGENNGEQ
ncbi:flagellar basal-body MS-ring/collar protein FliF [Mediterraneibacter agrestimuris]|uniref:flagellar basal-body MS-ring/collar protein FliF n=1 Tax=Mediterraneibacter agrestimuris TaxID=2941333 RepID=UPI0020420941|nr:flagellar basal-body MS-ring/collar protein FliF [Mediterraneibacter agrestimuris]